MTFHNYHKESKGMTEKRMKGNEKDKKKFPFLSFL